MKMISCKSYINILYQTAWQWYRSTTYSECQHVRINTTVNQYVCLLVCQAHTSSYNLIVNYFYFLNAQFLPECLTICFWLIGCILYAGWSWSRRFLLCLILHPWLSKLLCAKTWYSLIFYKTWCHRCCRLAKSSKNIFKLWSQIRLLLYRCWRL